MIVRLGGHSGLVNAYLAIEFSLLGVIAAAYGVSAALRLSSDEAEHRAEVVLAGPVGRIRWAAAQVLMAAGGIVALMAVAGLASGLADGLRTGQLGAELSRQLGAGLAQVPAAWLLAGLVVAVFGLAPRLSVPAGWTVLAVAALLDLLGPSLRLPQWLIGPLAVHPRAQAARRDLLGRAAGVAGGRGGRADRGGAGRLLPPRPDLT